MKGAPRLWATQRHPPVPSLKVSDTPSWRHRLGAWGAWARCDAVHRCSSIFYFLLLLLLLFFSRDGLQREKRSPNFFLDQNDVVLTLFYFRKNMSKQRHFGACSFKIKNKPKRRRFDPISILTPFSNCFQPDNPSKFALALAVQWRSEKDE